MIKLVKLTNDLFEDKNLSDVKLKPFAEDHLVRLGNNNPGGIYATLISATTAAYTDYFGSLTSQATKEAISEGLTIATTNARNAVVEKLSSQQGLVAYKFGKDSPTYQEFFPQGLEAYNKAKLDELPVMLTAYAEAATTHLTADFPAEVTAITGLITAYQTARDAQRSSFSETDIIRTGRRENRKVLTRQITTNMLTLAIDFLENPDGFDDYYDTQYLPKPSSGSSNGDDDDDGDDTGGGTTAPTDPSGVTISGSVIDNMSFMPIEGAMVEVTYTTGMVTAYTDFEGNYSASIPTLPGSSTADLKVSASGYANQQVPLTIEPGTNYTQNFELTTAP